MIVRWLLAGVVTVTSFCAATWISGFLVLPLMLTDAAARWGVAASVGVAVAALAALWGHTFSTKGAEKKGPVGTSGRAAETAGHGNVHNEILGGTFVGPVIQGRDVGQDRHGALRPPAQPPDSSCTPGAG